MVKELEFNQLSHFLAVVKFENLTRAASEVGISQPALSRSIQRLEEIIGQPLFERQARGVKLTEIGFVLKNRANQFKDLMDDTVAELSEVSNRALIRLAVIPTIAPYFLPSLLKKFGKLHPEIKIQVREDTTQNILRHCKDGDVDLAIVALPIDDKQLEVEPLFEDELLLVLPSGHPLQNKKVSFADIQEFPFISLDKQHCLSDNIAEYCSRKSISPIYIERTNQLSTIQELVALDHGISIIPAMARPFDKSKQRIYKSFAGDAPTRTIALLQNSGRYESRFVGMFKEFVRDLVG